MSPLAAIHPNGTHINPRKPKQLSNIFTWNSSHSTKPINFPPSHRRLLFLSSFVLRWGERCFFFSWAKENRSFVEGEGDETRRSYAFFVRVPLEFYGSAPTAAEKVAALRNPRDRSVRYVCGRGNCRVDFGIERRCCDWVELKVFWKMCIFFYARILLKIYI